MAAKSRSESKANGIGRDAQATRGYTLVEMLVVIAVIAVLAGILLPILSRSRAEARSTACKSNLSQMYKAVQLYLGDHTRYPACSVKPSISPGQARSSDTLVPYISDRRVFQCPADYKGFFEAEGSSYEWNVALNGRPQDTLVEEFLGASRTPMFYDYESFHPDPGGGSYGGKNVVFCDGSVGK